MSSMVRIRRGRLEAVVKANSGPDTGADVVEHIPAGRFYLRTGLGRRAGGSYYTPHEFVRHFVLQTLRPTVGRAIEASDPEFILRIKVFDPAMGSGHFLVEACRYLGDALYETCCRCDRAGSKEA